MREERKEFRSGIGYGKEEMRWILEREKRTGKTKGEIISELIQRETEEVGISDLGIVIPETGIKTSLIEERRIEEGENITSGFAENGLGSNFARIPFRDSLPELAAEAIRKIEYEDAKIWFFATESNTDASKPEIALKTLEILGLHNVICIPTTFACVAGIQATIPACRIAANSEEPVIVVCVDRSIYDSYNPRAEVTEGCAAAAARIETNPKLMALDYKRYGVYVEDIDDWRIPWSSYPFPVINNDLINIGLPLCVKKAFLDAKENNLDLINALDHNGRSIIDYCDFILPHCPSIKSVERIAAELWQCEMCVGEDHLTIEDCRKDISIYPRYKKDIDEIRKRKEFKEFYAGKIYKAIQGFRDIGNPYSANSLTAIAFALLLGSKDNIVAVDSFGSGGASVNILGKLRTSGYDGDIRKQVEIMEELSWDEYGEWRKQEIKRIMHIVQ